MKCVILTNVPPTLRCNKSFLRQSRTANPYFRFSDLILHDACKCRLYLKKNKKHNIELIFITCAVFICSSYLSWRMSFLRIKSFIEWFVYLMYVPFFKPPASNGQWSKKSSGLTFCVHASEQEDVFALPLVISSVYYQSLPVCNPFFFSSWLKWGKW